MMGGMPAAVFALCAAPAATCAPLTSSATCTPQHVDLTDPAWAGLEITGNVSPERWLAERPWLWPLLQAAVAALRASAKATFGVEAIAELAVTQYPDDWAPEAVLTVAAPVVGGDMLVADDRAFTFLWGEEDGPRPSHLDAVEALQEARFGACVLQEVRVSVSLWAGPLEITETHLPVRIEGPLPEAPDFVGQVHAMVSGAIRREQERDGVR